ncbi:hypothetical protein LQQ61_02385 (plasmid) [Escherichia coli]|nr:hypothetical protein LQQ61_02385 [Escherichia coli]
MERRAGIKFEPIRPYEFTGRGDRIGWVKGIDDNWHLTLFIENGRILIILGSAENRLLEIAKIHKGDFRITANQNLIIAGVPESEKAKIEKIAKESGLMNAVTHSVKTQWPACHSRLARWRWPKRTFPAVFLSTTSII